MMRCYDFSLSASKWIRIYNSLKILSQLRNGIFGVRRAAENAWLVFKKSPTALVAVSL